MPPTIRPGAGDAADWTVRPALRPGESVASEAETPVIGENSRVTVGADDAALITAALLAADAMRAVGAIGQDDDGTIVVAERNIDPATLDLEDEAPAQPEVTRLAGLEQVVPVLRPNDLPEVESEADVGVEVDEVVAETLVISTLAPEVVSVWPNKRPRFVVRTPPPVATPAPEIEVASAGVVPTPVPVPPPPAKRPKGLIAALFRAPDKPVIYPKEGSVCGDPAIRGQVAPPIPAKLAGCGLQDAVRITAVDGVALSTPATVHCGTAVALRSWVTNTVKPVVGDTGGGVSTLRVAASYSCRTRNNVPGAKVSEHGRGKAIDISAIILKDGTPMTVLKGWRHNTFGPMLKAMHAKACGTFGTVLGPNSDRYHQDHFHFDIASHGYGPYCR